MAVMRIASLVAFVVASTAGMIQGALAAPEFIGGVERFDPALDALIAQDAKIEKLAEGFEWSEGPAWISSGQYLLFTDVPANVMYRWSQQDGLAPFLKPSGYAGHDLSLLREPGANGLHPDGRDAVLVADSGSRTIARLTLIDKRKAVLATRYEGKRFNSPNDLVRRNDGGVYFTDPPYGLKGLNESPAKELAFNGVFRIAADGAVTLIDGDLSFPNGIGLSPDHRTLYVANSDPKKPIWVAYTLTDAGVARERRVIADAADLVKKNAPGLPDGMAIGAGGHLFVSAPGGVLVLTPDGARLGLIRTGAAIANCAFGDDGRSLYLTSDHLLARIRLKTRGADF
jgi:gluconolactonase